MGWAPLRPFGLKVGMGWGGGRSSQVAGKCESGDFRFRYSGVWSTGKRKAMGGRCVLGLQVAMIPTQLSPLSPPSHIGGAQPVKQPWTRRCRPRSSQSSRSSQKPSQETQGPSPACPKRPCPSPAPEAGAAPLELLTSRLFTQVGAMQALMEELQAPGGAFLPSPEPLAPNTQPSVQQRAWLSWQLAQTGATLHRAFLVLDTLLASSPAPPASSPPGLGALAQSWPSGPSDSTLLGTGLASPGDHPLSSPPTSAEAPTISQPTAPPQLALPPKRLTAPGSPNRQRLDRRG